MTLHNRYHFSYVIYNGMNHFSSIQSLSCVRLFATPWSAACQASMSINNSQRPPKPISIVLVMPFYHLILCCPLLLCPQSFPAWESFQMSQLSTSGGQTIRVSPSTPVLPMNTQDWSPLGWTGWISLQSKGLSRVFSWTGNSFHTWYYTCFNAILPNHPTFSLSHRVHKNDLYWQTTTLKTIQATPTAQLQKNKWPNQKMGQRTK